MLKLNTLFAGRYMVLEKIGSGGMADVYKAKDTKLEREVAIKVLKQRLAEDEEFVERFESEGQAAASLNNPNIISIYDVGNVGSTYYIVMELINGITLKEYIRRKGMLSARETMAISAQVAVGLRAAHAHHIVHRDIKPQNIILSRDGKVKVTDFGIARAVTDETKSVNNSTMGTVHYIAPEQAKGQICDERSDIYSLGIVMYEMITGQVPFDKETSIAIALAHMNETMVPPSELNAECPKALEQIIFRCTQKSRDRRYHNCTELLQDLKIAVQNPLFNFELQEQENLLKSDTNVFAIGGAGQRSGPDSSEKPNSGRATMIVDDNYDESEDTEDAIYVGRSSEDEDVPHEKKSDSFISDRKLFAEDQKEDEKTLLDKVLMIAGIVIGALIVCMIIYIIATLSGCTQKNRKDPYASVSSDTSDETSSDEFISLETVDEEKYDPEVDTIVPNVIGMSVQSAISLLNESDLQYMLSSAIIYSDEYKLGMICKQSYEEGTIVKRGSVIVISMSLGTDKFEIRPDYVNGPLANFKNDISSFGDIYDITYEKRNDDNVKANHIISIDPAEGIVQAGSKIVVVYSAGPEYVSCPDLSGKTKTEALNILLNNALNMGTTTYVNSEEIAENMIVSQQYEPGTRLKNGTTVNVVVSKGFEVVEVPDVTGKNVDEAKEELEALGFKVIIATDTDTTKKTDTVLKQDAEAGESIKKGSEITITVNREDTVVPVLKKALAEEAVEALKDLGYETKIEFVDTSDVNLNMTVKETKPKGGTKLAAGEIVTLVVYSYKNVKFAVNLKAAENGSATASETAAASGTVITLNAVPNEGYRLKEWKVIEGGITISDNTFTMSNRNVTIEPVFEPVETQPSESESSQPSSESSSEESQSEESSGESTGA